MRKLHFILLTLSLVLTNSCKEDKKKVGVTTENQMTKVMAIHDDVMPKMGKVGRLVGQLRKKIDANQGGVIEKNAMNDLQDANAAMMKWMQDFGTNFDSDEILNGKALTAEKQALLNQEEQKIIEVKEKIETSISKAEKILAEN